MPVCFYSRKLTGSQKNWTAREKEAYAIIASLSKWAGWIGCSPVEDVTDHKSLEDWVKEHVETKSGLTGRRARWHEIFSQFDLTKVYKPGKDNVVADAMSRWAYPASTAKGDVSIHGTAESAQEVNDMEEEQTQWRKADVGRRKDEERENECYKLVEDVRVEGLTKLQVPRQDVKVDLFATKTNAQEAFFITREMNAFAFDRSKLSDGPNVLWGNPPSPC